MGKRVSQRDLLSLLSASVHVTPPWLLALLSQIEREREIRQARGRFSFLNKNSVLLYIHYDIYTHTYTHISIYIHAYIYTYIYDIYIHAYKYTYIYDIYIHTCMHACIHTYIYIYIIFLAKVVVCASQPCPEKEAQATTPH